MSEKTPGFYCGIALVLSDMVRAFDQPSMVTDFMDRHGVTVADLERDGADADDVYAVQLAVCGGGRKDWRAYLDERQKGSAASPPTNAAPEAKTTKEGS